MAFCASSDVGSTTANKYPEDVSIRIKKLNERDEQLQKIDVSKLSGLELKIHSEKRSDIKSELWSIANIFNEWVDMRIRVILNHQLLQQASMEIRRLAKNADTDEVKMEELLEYSRYKIELEDMFKSLGGSMD